MNHPSRNLICLLIAALVAGCSAQAEPPREPPRPVSFVALTSSNPSAMSRLTGTAESWKREEIAFEVPGRVARMVEPGATIEGRTLDENGKLLTEGTVLAELDDERYQLALTQSEAAAEAVRTELEQVIPEQLNEALAALELQDKQVERYTSLVAENAASKQDLDRFIAGQKTAKANVAKVEALRATKASELTALLTQIDQSKRNIRDCKLYSPFTGQVARVHVIPGGYAFRGIPVMTVQMMDPMKVDIAVSPETDARIYQNDLLHVYTPSGQKVDGLVYLKDTFADPSTRTFLVTLLVRNYRTEIGVPDELKDKPIARCRNLWKLDRPDTFGSGNYYTEVNAIHKDDDGHFVWKADNLAVDQMYDDFSPVLTVRKVRVEPGDGRIPALQIFTFRELADKGELDPAKDVIVGEVSGEVENGGQVVLVRERWSLRPGDVVRVGLKGEEVPAGFYVPEQAIQFDGAKHFVMVAKLAGDAHEASQVAVTVAETVGDLQRIEPVSEAELAEGTKVIIEGSHYLQQGDLIRPVNEVQPLP